MTYDFEDALTILAGSEYSPGAKASIGYDGPPISVLMADEYFPGAKSTLVYDPSISFGGSSITVISSALNPGIERAT